MARLPPTRKYRKRKPGRDRPLPPPGKGELRIRQVRSGIGRPAFERRTLEALGLKHHQAVVVSRIVRRSGACCIRCATWSR